MQSAESAQTYETHGDEDKTEHDDQQPLNDVVDGCGEHAAKHRITAHAKGIDEQKQSQIQIRVIGMQVAALLLFGQKRQLAFLLYGQRSGGLFLRQALQPGEIRHRSLFHLRVFCGRFDHQRLHGFAGEQIPHGAAIDRDQQDIDSVQPGQKPALKPVEVDIARAQIARPLLQHRGEPVKRRDQQHQVLKP
ncbi:MAG: hypothetical protein BWY83_02623 [bacterium ADurb.Bin478]|nr:MAG: hypothetical protein BWY83_02623 [bacterium ADurb.Bin478]